MLTRTSSGRFKRRPSSPSGSMMPTRPSSPGLNGILIATPSRGGTARLMSSSGSRTPATLPKPRRRLRGASGATSKLASGRHWARARARRRLSRLQWGMFQQILAWASPSGWKPVHGLRSRTGFNARLIRKATGAVCQRSHLLRGSYLSEYQGPI